MTQTEFSRGWRLLILQPWGRWYRTVTAQGTPTEEAKAQLEFYYDKLKWAHGEAWWRVASEYAQGKEWPSVNELKLSLSVINQHFVKAIADTPTREWTPMPDEVRQLLARLGVGPRDA